MGAIYRETNWRWALFVVGWSTGIAYGVATVFYQAMKFPDQPQVSGLWIGGLVTSFLLTVGAMRWWGRRRGEVAQIVALSQR
jgi:ferrous iron transport protein B